MFSIGSKGASLRLLCGLWIAGSLLALSVAWGQEKPLPFRKLDQDTFTDALRHIIDDADVGFANSKGTKLSHLGDKWEALSPLPSAYFCDVDWNEAPDKDPKQKASFYCDLAEGLTRDQAMRDLATLKDAVTKATKPAGWRGIIQQGDDSFELFAPPDGLACGWMKVWIEEDQPARFRLFLRIDSNKTPAQLTKQMTTAALSGAEAWVKIDLGEYIAASKSGFQQYKTGTSQMIAGRRVWNSRKPMLADSCQVVALMTDVLVCQLSHYKTLQEAENNYRQLLGYVTNIIPTWTKTPNPFPAEIVSVALKSAELGLEGEIWIHRDPNKPEWSLHYQILKRTPQ